MATIAALLALLIVGAAGGSVIWMYVLPSDDGGFNAPLGMSFLIAKDFFWPPFAAIALGFVGLIALAASLAMRGTLRPLP